MNALILSANTGQGHNSCAKAIREVFLSHGDLCDIEDVFGLVSEKLSRTITQNHEKSYRETPQRSAEGYRWLEDHPGWFAKNRFVYRVMSIGRKQITRRIQEGNYDTVICTHVLAAMILTSAMQHEDLPVQSAFVATDYSCSPGVNGTELDYYFIPHETLVSDFILSEVPPEKIVPTGIPVQKDFVPVDDKSSFKESFEIHPEDKHLLIMCGSMGCGPIPQLLDFITTHMSSRWEVTVVCGTNNLLKNELESKYRFNPFVHIRGYENRMSSLLSSADLYLTKPGGLSVTEAAAAGIPMVLIDAVAGCEKNNLRHFVKLGAAITGDSVQEVAQACINLMNNPSELNKMKRSLKTASPYSAAEQIWLKLNASAF